MHEVPPGRAVVPKPGVLSMRHEREPTLRQRVEAEHGQRHLAEPRDPRASRCHQVTDGKAQGDPHLPHRRTRLIGIPYDLPPNTSHGSRGGISQVVSDAKKDPTTNCPDLMG